MSFQQLGLIPTILDTIQQQGYSEPTPIQQQAIPLILEGHDLLGGSQTGTGKTAAFTLPLLQRLSQNAPAGQRYPRALILTPTRELAAQVGYSVKSYGKGLQLRSSIIFGGVSIVPQKNHLKQGVDIVIGTPGRLLDLAGQKALNLNHIEILVLDEADRMLDMGFIHDIRKIIRLTPKKRQTLFFSATYSKEIKALADTILHQPKSIEVTRGNSTVEAIAQSAFSVPKARKSALLKQLITDGNWNQVLVFTSTKHGANRLSMQLDKAGITSAAIHGNKSQSARTSALANFKASKIQVLVATDIAARGLDIDRLPHVVNYDLPRSAEDYVHRIGRTGRAGCTGEAISLVSEEDFPLLTAIERLTKHKIELKQMPGFELPPSAFKKDLDPAKKTRPHHREKPKGPKHSGRRPKSSSRFAKTKSSSARKGS